jgi:hypothetical protein
LFLNRCHDNYLVFGSFVGGFGFGFGLGFGIRGFVFGSGLTGFGLGLGNAWPRPPTGGFGLLDFGLGNA